MITGYGLAEYLLVMGAVIVILYVLHCHRRNKRRIEMYKRHVAQERRVMEQQSASKLSSGNWKEKERKTRGGSNENIRRNDDDVDLITTVAVINSLPDDDDIPVREPAPFNDANTHGLGHQSGGASFHQSGGRGHDPAPTPSWDSGSSTISDSTPSYSNGGSSSSSSDSGSSFSGGSDGGGF